MSEENEEKKMIEFPSESGDIADLPQEIIDDVRRSIQAYFGCDATIDEHGWDVDRGCKVMNDTKTGNVIFCKIVTKTTGEPQIAVLHLPRETVDAWVKY